MEERARRTMRRKREMTRLERLLGCLGWNDTLSWTTSAWMKSAWPSYSLSITLIILTLESSPAQTYHNTLLRPSWHSSHCYTTSQRTVERLLTQYGFPRDCTFHDVPKIGKIRINFSGIGDHKLTKTPDPGTTLQGLRFLRHAQWNCIEHHGASGNHR